MSRMISKSMFTDRSVYNFPGDYYSPRDYYGQASHLAQKYCRDHPDADKEVVYMAASEVAEFYDVGGTGTKAKFSLAVAVKIRTALLVHRRKKENMITKEEKAAMIADRKRGMTYGQIAEKYKRNLSTVTSNFYNWEHAGLLDEEIPVKKAEKKKPDPLPSEAYPGQIGPDDSPEDEREYSEPETSEKLSEVQEKLDEIFDNPESPRYTLPDGKWQSEFFQGSVPPLTKAEQMGRLLGALPTVLGGCKVLCQTADEENGRVIVKAEGFNGKITTIIMEDVT